MSCSIIRVDNSNNQVFASLILLPAATSSFFMVFVPCVLEHLTLISSFVLLGGNSLGLELRYIPAVRICIDLCAVPRALPV